MEHEQGMQLIDESGCLVRIALVQYRRRTDPLYLSMAMPPLQPAEGR